MKILRVSLDALRQFRGEMELKHAQITPERLLQELAGPERKDTPLALCEIKFDAKAAANDPTKPVEFEGYGSVWDSVDSWGDTMRQGAFARSIKARRPMMLLGHNPRIVPGKWVSYSEDNKGLKVTGELTPGHADAQNLAASLKHGSMNGLSVGGYTVKSEPSTDGRNISEFDLYEISPVSMPAEDKARIDTASVKSMLDRCDSVSDFEDMLREAAGFSKTAATAWVSRLVRIARGEPVAKGADKVLAEMTSTLSALKIPKSLTGA